MQANGKENRTSARKKVLNLTAVIYPDADSDWLVAQNPETGTTTQGKTFEEALANLEEATELYLAMLIGDKSGPAIIAHTYGDVRPDHLLAQAQRIRLTVDSQSAK